MSLPEEVVRDVMRAAHGAAPQGPCPDADVLALYAEQALDRDERTGVESHVAGCGRCQETLAAFVRSAPESTAVGAGGVGVVLSWWSGWRWLVPMAATAALVVVAVWVGRGPSDQVNQLAQRDAAPVAESAGDVPSPSAASATPPAATPSAAPTESLARRSAPTAATNPSLRFQADADEGKALKERANAAGAASGALAKTVPSEEARKAARQEPAQAADAFAGARERDKVAALEDQMRQRQAAAAPPPPPPAAQAPPPVPGAPAAPAAAPAVAVAEAPAAGAQTPTFRAAVPERRAEAADAAKPAPTANAILGASADAKQEAGRLVADGRADASNSWRLRDGRIERTLDAGRTWQAARLPDGFRATAIATPSPTVCWAIGPQGVARTVDGRTWTRVTVPTTEPLRAIVATDATSATVTTASGATVVVRP